MPDICMCPGHGCPRKDSCYRHTATPTPHRQRWFAVTPLREDGTCEHHLPVWTKKEPETTKETDRGERPSPHMAL